VGRQTVLDVIHDSNIKILKARRVLSGAVSTVVAALGTNLDGVVAVGRDYYATSSLSNVLVRIQYNSPNNYTATFIAGTSGTAGNADGVGVAATFNNPRGIIASPDGKFLYVCDLFGFRVRRIAIATATVTTIAGNNTGTDVDGVGTAASFQNPTGVAIDSTGQFLYVTTFGGLRLIALNSGAVTTLVSGAQYYDVVTVGNRLYYTAPDHYLRSSKLDGTDRRIEAGAGVAGSADGFGPSATLNQPWGLAYDGVDTIYIASYAGNRIRTFNPITTEVKTLAGSGVASSVDGVGVAATFNSPNDVCLDNEGRLIVVQNASTNVRAIL
jgi:DNA-binding beta-propeller fold protein YncE